MLVIEVQLILVSSYPCATSKCNLSFGAIYPSGAIYPLVQLMKMYNIPFAIKSFLFYIMCNIQSEPNHDYMSGKAITR